MVYVTQSEKLPNGAKNNENTLALRSTITFSDDDLSEEAKKQFKFHEQILHTFQLYADHILANDQLSPIGRHLFCAILERNYKNAKKVLNYVASHPEITMPKNVLPPQLVVCSLPRTGSTLLYNLLACDPGTRATLHAEIEEPIPPSPRSDTAAQIKRNESRQEFHDMCTKLGLDPCLKDFRASHPDYDHEGDMHIFYHTGFSYIYGLISSPHNEDLIRWIEDETDKAFAYDYHKIFIQMLNSVDPPNSHWLLKASLHNFYLDELVRQYPSAMLIMIHRRPDERTASSIRYLTSHNAPFFYNGETGRIPNAETTIRRIVTTLDTKNHRMVKFRRTHPNFPCYDVQYDELLTNPIDTVRRIYQHFGLKWSEQFETAMGNWLQVNYQGKQGRNTYSLSDYNLTVEDIESRCKEYTDMFLKPQHSSKED